MLSERARNEILLSISVEFTVQPQFVHAVLSLDYIRGNENMGIFAI